MEKKSRKAQIIGSVVFGILSILCVLPFMIVISTSFASEVGIAANGYSVFPKEFNVDAYKYVFKNPFDILSAYGMSIFVTGTGTIFGLMCMTAFAYALARDDFKFKKVLSFFIYFTMLFSGGQVATYIWFSGTLKLNGNPLVLILPHMLSAYNIFILRTSCKNTSVELIEAAKIDGCNELRTFVSIVIPVQKTVIATIALLMIFAYWNEWYLSMMYMDTSDLSTIQYYLVRTLETVNFAKQHQGAMGGSIAYDLPSEGVQMAICVLATGPLLIVFPFLQKYFVSGIQVGAVKG